MFEEEVEAPPWTPGVLIEELPEALQDVDQELQQALLDSCQADMPPAAGGSVAAQSLQPGDTIISDDEEDMDKDKDQDKDKDKDLDMAEEYEDVPAALPPGPVTPPAPRRPWTDDEEEEEDDKEERESESSSSPQSVWGPEYRGPLPWDSGPEVEAAPAAEAAEPEEEPEAEELPAEKEVEAAPAAEGAAAAPAAEVEAAPAAQAAPAAVVGAAPAAEAVEEPERKRRRLFCKSPAQSFFVQ